MFISNLLFYMLNFCINRLRRFLNHDFSRVMRGNVVLFYYVTENDLQMRPYINLILKIFF